VTQTKCWSQWSMNWALKYALNKSANVNNTDIIKSLLKSRYWWVSTTSVYLLMWDTWLSSRTTESYFWLNGQCGKVSLYQPWLLCSSKKVKYIYIAVRPTLVRPAQVGGSTKVVSRNVDAPNIELRSFPRPCDVVMVGVSVLINSIKAPTINLCSVLNSIIRTSYLWCDVFVHA